MDIVIDLLYLIFAALSLYLSIMFFVLYFDNKKELFKVPKMKKFPSVSILIPAYNEEKTIGETIRKVKEMKYPKEIEVIVINDGSTDNTLKVAKRVAKKYKKIKVIDKPNGGKASALNVGLKYAKGEIVGVVDADSYPTKNALMNSIPFFSEKDVGAVTTSIFVKSPKNWIERLQRIEYIMIVWARKLLECIDSVYATPGVLSLYRKNALKKVGGFDTNNMTEDIEIAWRLIYHGYKIKMSLKSESNTKVPNNFRSWWKQRVRWNIGGMQTWFKYLHTFLKKDFKSLGMFILPFFTLSYVVSLSGLFLLLFVIGRSIYNYITFNWGVYSLGGSPSFAVSFVYLPDMFTIFGITIFTISIIWVNISFKTVKRRVGWPKGLLDLILYLTIYITIFPFNLIYSGIKFLRGKYEW
ncbi:MAG: glycosyltransferase family 2 protein [Candidatus Aenigmarchaeota archaeon]|nr:glycosyltransferase family 2 protein [Candidatus Aenigmarchaeota archaeon]